MKKFTFFICLLLFSFIIHGKDKLLESFLEYPTVKDVYESCQKKKDNKQLTDTIANCVWSGIDDKTKEDLQEVLSSVEDNNNQKQRSPATDDVFQGRKYEGVSIASIKHYKQDPALEKVSDFLHQRMEKSIYGMNDKKTKIIDHQKFHVLYRSQIGKNIIYSLSAYCVESKMFDKNNRPGNFLIEKSKIKDNRKKNISLLTEFTPRGDNKVYKVWEHCVKNIKHICYQEKGLNRIDYGDEEILKKHSYEHNRACQVTHYIREHRQNLLITKNIQDAMKKNAQQTDNVSFEANVAFYDNGHGQNEEDFNEMTTVSSREFYDAYKVEAKKIAEDFKEKCLKNKDAKECSKFLITGEEKKKLEKDLAEFELRRKAMQEKISNIRSPAEIRRYMLEEGYKEDELDKILGNSTDEEFIRDAINKYYSKEKESIIASINEDKQKRVSSGDEIDFNTKKDIDILKNISEELHSKGTRYREMLHFSNIVSSFLIITSEDSDKLERNTASLFREIKFEEAAQKTRVPANNNDDENPTNLTDIKLLREEVEKASITKDDTSTSKDDTKAGARYLEVEVINENFLNYKKRNPPLQSDE